MKNDKKIALSLNKETISNMEIIKGGRSTISQAEANCIGASDRLICAKVKKTHACIRRKGNQ